MSNLDQITAEFQVAYDKNTEAKGSLGTTQQALFDAFTSELMNGPLGRRSVPSPFPHWDKMTEKTQDAWIQRHHPGMRQVGYSNEWLILEEDPVYLKYTYINRDTGKVYGRTRVEGKPGLDDESLRAENPALWDRITEWPQPWYALVKDVVEHFISLRWSEDAINSQVGHYLALHGVQRILLDFSQLSDEDLMDLEDYFIPGPVTVRLVPPREAKPEELEGREEDEEEF